MGQITQLKKSGFQGMKWNDEIASLGLSILGGFQVNKSDIAQWNKFFELEHSEDTPFYLYLIGNIGSKHYDIYAKLGIPKKQSMDVFTQEALETIFSQSKITKAFYPSIKPYAPFQSWAKRAHIGYSSPLGMLVHPKWGLWFAFRAAILSTDKIEGLIDNPYNEEISPCIPCSDKPCISNCPAKAVKAECFNYQNCQNYLRDNSHSHCATYSCIARNSCPIGQEYRYSDEHQKFHMALYVDQHK